MLLEGIGITVGPKSLFRLFRVQILLNLLFKLLSKALQHLVGSGIPGIGRLPQFTIQVERFVWPQFLNSLLK